MHIKEFNNLEVSWDSILFLANSASADEPNPSVRKVEQSGYENSKYVYQNDLASILGTIGYLQFVSKMPSSISEIDDLVKNIDVMLGIDVKRDSFQVFCNVVSTPYISQIHFDPWASAVFQIKGTTLWDIFSEDGKDITDSILLEEGDLILVPKKALHRITSNSSRATLNFIIPGTLNQNLQKEKLNND
jgi:hypothetical protein